MGMLKKLKENLASKTKEEIQAEWDSGNHWDEVGEPIQYGHNFERFLQQELNTTQGLRVILDTTPVEDIERLVYTYAVDCVWGDVP